MSDILVYVKDTSFCCVIAENTDAELESFRHEMEAQVDDLLCFLFKFTRLVNGKRVTVAVKQEAFIKLKQCIVQSHEAAIYLIQEELRPKNPPTTLSPPSLKMQAEKKRMSSHRRLKKPRSRNNPL